MSKYEMLILLNNEATDEARDAELTKLASAITAANGTVVSTDKWGTKKLAYPVNFKTEAYFVLMTFEAETSVCTELVRLCNISADVMRQMITKIK